MAIQSLEAHSPTAAPMPMGLGLAARRQTAACCCIGGAGWLRQEDRRPCQTPPGPRRRLPVPPALSPCRHTASPRLCQGCDSLGHQAHPTARSGDHGQAGLPAPHGPAHPGGTVPGRQLGWLEGQRSAVSCPVEIKRKQRRVKDPGASGISSPIRQKAGVSSPPPSCPSLSCLQCCLTRTSTLSKLLPEMRGASKAVPGLEPDPQIPSCQRCPASCRQGSESSPAQPPTAQQGRGCPLGRAAWGAGAAGGVPQCQPCCQSAIWGAYTVPERLSWHSMAVLQALGTIGHGSGGDLHPR